MYAKRRFLGALCIQLLNFKLSKLKVYFNFFFIKDSTVLDIHLELELILFCKVLQLK